MNAIVGPTRAPRAARHDALAAILPAEARARMALILTEDDFATLRHLAEKGTGANTLRAIASDLNYLETWSHAALGHALPWPATEALALKFIAHHLYDEDQHERDPTHGMPKDVRALLLQDGCLKKDGPHAPATVRRRVALWSTVHRWKGLEAPFGLPSVRHAMRLAVRANPRPRGRKSAKAVTITEAARQNVPLQEAMAQSRHRSVQQAANYYNGAEMERGRAARLG